MESKINKLKNILLHSGYKWMKLLAITGGAQILIQGLGLISGILIIRLMPLKEYALYTLANTMLGTMTILSDGGIAYGVLAEGGKVWSNKNLLGSVINTGLSMRRKFAIGSLVVSVPILFYLLYTQNAPWYTSILIVLSLIPTFFAALSDSILEIAPKLHQDIATLQKNQLVVSLLRFFLICSSIFFFPFAYIVFIATGLTRIYGNLKLKEISFKYVNKHSNFDKRINKNILSLAKRMLPESIYYCLSGQISIWLITFFGNTQSIAGLGALSKFSVVTIFFSTFFTTLIIPRFSKLRNNANEITKFLIFSIFIAFLIMLLFVFLGYLFSDQLLWVLGTSYSKFKNELVLSLIASAVSFMLGVVFSLNVSRAWAINPIIYIPLSIIYTIISCLISDLSTLKGIIFFSIYISCAQFFTLLFYSFYKISKLRIEQSIISI